MKGQFMLRRARRVASVVVVPPGQPESAGSEGADGGRGLRPRQRPHHRGTVRECCLHISRGIGSAGGDTLSPLCEAQLASRSRVATPVVPWMGGGG